MYIINIKYYGGYTLVAFQQLLRIKRTVEGLHTKARAFLNARYTLGAVQRALS